MHFFVNITNYRNPHWIILGTVFNVCNSQTVVSVSKLLQMLCHWCVHVNGYCLLGMCNTLTLPVCESLRLLVMFRCNGQSVQENEHNHPPVEQPGLHIHSAFAA